MVTVHARAKRGSQTVPPDVAQKVSSAIKAEPSALFPGRLIIPSLGVPPLRTESTKRFSDRADVYAKYRPGYPREVLGFLTREVRFDRESVVADVGSGTGLLARLCLENGNLVLGVEPNDDMRRQAERELASFGRFVSVEGVAEATTLPDHCADLISVGQALHWFDPAKSVSEFGRVSKPGGSLCVVYNVRDRRAARMRAYQRLVKKYERDRAGIPNADVRYISRFFKGRRFSKFSVPNVQVLDFEGLMGRLLSASYMPNRREDDAFLRMEEDVRDMFETYSSEGLVRMAYQTVVLVGPLATR